MPFMWTLRCWWSRAYVSLFFCCVLFLCTFEIEYRIYRWYYGPMSQAAWIPRKYNVYWPYVQRRKLTLLIVSLHAAGSFSVVVRDFVFRPVLWLTARPRYNVVTVNLAIGTSGRNRNGVASVHYGIALRGDGVLRDCVSLRSMALLVRVRLQCAL